MILKYFLGKGATATVVIGEDKLTQQRVAIKVIDKSKLDKNRMNRELKLLKNTDHTNIVRLYKVYDSTGDLNHIFLLISSQ
jgi:serine/threonine protein kinase